MAIQGNARGYMACRYITTQVSGVAWRTGSVPWLVLECWRMEPERHGMGWINSSMYTGIVCDIMLYIVNVIQDDELQVIV